MLTNLFIALGVILALLIVAACAWAVWRELHPVYPVWPESVADLPTQLRDDDDFLGIGS